MSEARDRTSVAPWADHGGWVGTAHERARSQLLQALRAGGFDVVELEGERIVNRESFLGEAARALGVEAPREPTWQAFAASLEAAGRTLGPRTALVWRRADYSSFFSMPTVVEAVHALLEWRRDLGARGTHLEVFLLGQTRDFPVPEEAAS
jgi:hypothetical protein